MRAQTIAWLKAQKRKVMFSPFTIIHVPIRPGSRFIQEIKIRRTNVPPRPKKKTNMWTGSSTCWQNKQEKCITSLQRNRISMDLGLGSWRVASVTRNSKIITGGCGTGTTRLSVRQYVEPAVQLRRRPKSWSSIATQHSYPWRRIRSRLRCQCTRLFALLGLLKTSGLFHLRGERAPGILTHGYLSRMNRRCSE